MTEESPGPVVKDDDDSVLDQSMNDRMETSAQVAALAPEQPEQGDVTMPCLVESKIQNPESKIEEGLSEKVQNKPNLESSKGPESQEIQPETAAADGQEQTQSGAAVASAEGRVPSEWISIQNPKSSGQRPVNRKAASRFPRRGVPPVPRSDTLDAPGDGPMKSGTRRVSLADLTRIIVLRPG